jgi:hypothetical protein
MNAIARTLLRIWHFILPPLGCLNCGKDADLLDAEIAALNEGLAAAKPVLEANSQGAAFARMFDLPDSKAEFLLNWQNFAMAATVEMLIVAAMIAFEVLGRAGKPIKPSELPGRPEKATGLEPLHETSGEAFRGIPASPRPRLVASSPEPTGNVATIISEIMEPGTARQKVEIADLFKACAATCRKLGKHPVSPGDFSSALQRLCDEIGIKVAHKGERVYLMKVRLREVEASVGRN